MAKLIRTRIDIEGRISEELALVEEPRTTAWDVEEELNVVGKPIPRIDGDQRVSGGARFPSDIQLPGMLHAKFLRSPHPHARVLRVDTSRAEKLPGVRAVISRNNAPTTEWRNSQPIFGDSVRYAGDEVAAVAADNIAIARQAVKLIQVQYEPLTFVLDPEAALRPDAVKLYPNGNLLDGKPDEYARGDVEKAFKQADVIVEGVFETPTQMHNSLETHGSVVTWEGDQLTIYDSTQYIHGVRDRVADWFGLPKNKVRVIKQFMGGGFGSKGSAGKYTVVAALLAKRTGRPVRLFLDRTEENLAAGHRSLSRQYLKIGAKRDGTLVAMELTGYQPLGAYASWGASVGGPMRELYDCKNVRTREYLALTNAGSFAPFRAPGYVEGMFALEVLMDELAVKLQVDPLELRIKNYARRAPISKLPFSSNGLLDAYQEGARAIGWERRGTVGYGRRTVPGGPIRRGIGMASQIWSGAGGPPSYAQVKIHPDASVTVITGTQDIGTGTKTILAQIAAEELGLPLKSIRVEIGDTQWGLYSQISAGSMTAASVGPAVREAAADAKAQLLKVASQFLRVRRKGLTLRDGILRGEKRGKPVETPLADVMGELGDVMIVGHGSRAPNPSNVEIHTFGAQFAEIEVDVETGVVRVVKIVASHDVGRVLNPLTLSSQIEGGVIQGLGFALMEQQLTDANTGAVVNPNLEGYRIPTMLDIPEIEVRMIDRADVRINNLGAKGAGEPPIIPTAPAIVNAVRDAIGISFHQLPLTPDRVLDALEKAEKNAI
ncbi:MAG: xanthine dehydrogenase family protein molybdopterin-binding subunit [Chloroflexi bacterium]|nr:xanthine dehydrogenase family protein molybdopterin-binding subunit [Chloroflexota bacterium]